MKRKSKRFRAKILKRITRLFAGDRVAPHKALTIVDVMLEALWSNLKPGADRQVLATYTAETAAKMVATAFDRGNANEAVVTVFLNEPLAKLLQAINVTAVQNQTTVDAVAEGLIKKLDPEAAQLQN